MTDPVPNGAAASRADSFLTDYLAEEAARNTVADALRPENKAALFDVLEAAGVTAVTVAFDGCGDSGQIESIDARDELGEVALPGGDIPIATPTSDGGDVIRQTLPLRDAIETLCYDLLEETHDGWENDDGAYGAFVFDVAARIITLDHNSRYTAAESTEHHW
jgi:hypothetical protein